MDACNKNLPYKRKGCATNTNIGTMMMMNNDNDDILELERERVFVVK